MSKRVFPRVMATQHPDNAHAPYWQDSAFVDTAAEVGEVYENFSTLNCDEYMWDWEGKHVDEGVMDKLMEQHLTYFKRNAIGKKVFLTYRLPNIWAERGFRLSRAFVNIISANEMVASLKLHTPPIFEAILPMCDSADKLMHIHAAYAKMRRAFPDAKPRRLELIPLVEDVDHLFNIDKLLENYVRMYHEKGLHKKQPLAYMRPFIARSDPALNYGLIPAVLSAHVATAKIYQCGETNSITMKPIIGSGSLPFRGSLNPKHIKTTLHEYEGIHTFTVQSAFRYDYDQKQVQAAIREIKRAKCRPPKKVIDAVTARMVLKNARAAYQRTVEKIAPFVQRVAKHVPARRERKLHVGLFGYARQVGKAALPRAIKFTGSLYSVGVPPEFIGTGHALNAIGADTVLEMYASLPLDLQRAGRYLNRENLKKLAKNQPGFKYIMKDVALCEDLLGTKFEPKDDDHLLHQNLTSNILILLKHEQKRALELQEEIVRAAKIRKSLG